MKIPNALKILLEKQQYGFVGDHSAIKICAWTKKSLLNKGVCYKQKFYGINAHRCCQITPSVAFCQNRCEICWRPVEYTIGKEMDGEVDDPKDIVKNSIAVTDKVTQIAFASEEQSTAIEQISKNVETISAVTQESAFSMQQTAQTVENFNQKIRRLPS